MHEYDKLKIYNFHGFQVLAGEQVFNKVSLFGLNIGDKISQIGIPSPRTGKYGTFHDAVVFEPYAVYSGTKYIKHDNKVLKYMVFTCENPKKGLFPLPTDYAHFLLIPVWHNELMIVNAVYGGAKFLKTVFKYYTGSLCN